MTHRPVICDECVSPAVARYLEEMGQEVIVINNGMSDNTIKRIGRKTNAYIVTKDKGFTDYQKAIIIRRDSPEAVYERLMECLKSER
jgi:predicted nuclease of predicted toxin-antitoxin system